MLISQILKPGGGLAVVVRHGTEAAVVRGATSTYALASEAIAGGNAQAINYFVAQKYVEAVGKFATSPNAKTILFPVEATQLIGTLGGIGELVRDALGDGPKKG